MTLAREINRVAAGILIVFGVITLSAGYWAIFGPDTILRREDNPRLVVAEAAIRRGAIADRSGVVLAESEVTGDDEVTRYYVHPEASSLVGYSSLRYGVGGAEAAYNTILRGDNLSADLIDQLVADALHQPQVGSDVQLTLDLRIQEAMLRAMGDQVGAAVVLDVPDGGILGLVSLPTFDANTLDANWETLAASPQKPFFNRVLQGRYQPGGTLQTPLLAAALIDGQSITDTVSNGTASVKIDDLQVTCALRLPSMELSLRDAYGFACPLPFARLADQLGTQAISDTLDTFQFNSPPALADFASQTQAETPPAAPFQVGDDTLRADALGQSDLTVNPLQMAVMAAAVINDGNAPQPYTLLATRSPDIEDWTSAEVARPTIPYATEKTARQLQDLMRNAVVNGAALNAARPGIDIGGHAALAYSGDETQAWFIGFVTLPARQGIAVAVVLENSADPGLAADVGGTILRAAHDVLNPQEP